MRHGLRATAFLVAIHQYGLLSQICCDQGGEDWLVAHHMIHHV